VRLRNPCTGDLVREIRASDLPVWSMCEVPVGDGFLLATGSGDGKVRLWNSCTGDLVYAMKIDFARSSPTGANQVNSLCAVSLGGRTVLAIGGSNVEIWNPESGNRLHILNSRADRDIKFLCEIEINGHHMLAGSDYDGTCAELWDPADRYQGNPLEVQRGIELIGAIRTGSRTFLACKTFDTIALQDLQAIFKRTF
jgi:WD40 repeat protein